MAQPRRRSQWKGEDRQARVPAAPPQTAGYRAGTAGTSETPSSVGAPNQWGKSLLAHQTQNGPLAADPHWPSRRPAAVRPVPPTIPPSKRGSAAAVPRFPTRGCDERLPLQRLRPPRPEPPQLSASGADAPRGGGLQVPVVAVHPVDCGRCVSAGAGPRALLPPRLFPPLRRDAALDGRGAPAARPDSISSTSLVSTNLAPDMATISGCRR